MKRFLVDFKSERNGTILLSKEESRHAVKVLRLEAGHVVELFDGLGKVMRGIVGAVESGQLAVSLDQSSASQRAETLPLMLAVSLIRSEKLEWAIQKAVELGVTRIGLIAAHRSVVRWKPGDVPAKLKRLQRIAVESAKQCGRAQLPEITAPCSVQDLLARESRAFDAVWIPTLARPGRSLSEALLRDKPNSILALIGPEGDFTIEESELACRNRADAITLGSLIMRAETAAIYIASVASFYYDSRGRGLF